MARLSNAELLQKATMTTANLGGGTGGINNGPEAPLSIEQVDRFYRLAVTPQAILPEVREVKNTAAKWQESKIQFGGRILRKGVQGTRLADGDRVVPDTGMVEISCELMRGEVPIGDEVMEDQVERAGFGDTVMALIAENVGRDIEDLLLNGETAGAGGLFTADSNYLQTLNGWMQQCRDGAGANLYDAVGDSQDYQTIMGRMLTMLPDRFKRDIDNMRYYVPLRFLEKYRDQLSARGTALGDASLEGVREHRYQGILIKPVPLQLITPGSPDTTHILLAHRTNLMAGYQRMVRMESWRDPREGVTSFVVNCRIDAKIQHVPATVVAKNVDVEP